MVVQSIPFMLLSRLMGIITNKIWCQLKLLLQKSCCRLECVLSSYSCLPCEVSRSHGKKCVLVKGKLTRKLMIFLALI